MNIRPFQPADEAVVIQLWERCGLTRPWNDPRKDIARKLAEQPELFLIGEMNDEIIATAMAGFDGHRGWVYYFAVSPDHQKRSYGRQLMEYIEARLIERGCPKINLMVRGSNRTAVAFYERLGYEQEDVIAMGRRLIPDDDG